MRDKPTHFNLFDMTITILNTVSKMQEVSFMLAGYATGRVLNTEIDGDKDLVRIGYIHTELPLNFTGKPIKSRRTVIRRLSERGVYTLS